jgi:hypothetical protein
MQTLTIEITHKSGIDKLQSLADKKFIRIVDQLTDSAALPGEQMSLTNFKNWIVASENAKTIDLKKAKTRWTIKKSQLEKLTK